MKLMPIGLLMRMLSWVNVWMLGLRRNLNN